MGTKTKVKLDAGKNLVLVIAILCLTILEIVALLMRVDGQLFATVISAIGAMVGYLFGKGTEKK